MINLKQIFKKIPLKAYIIVIVFFLNSFYLITNVQNNILDPDLVEKMYASNLLKPFTTRSQKITLWGKSIYFVDYNYFNPLRSFRQYNVTNMTINGQKNDISNGHNFTIITDYNTILSMITLNDHIILGLDEEWIDPNGTDYTNYRMFYLNDSYSNSTYYPIKDLIIPCELQYNDFVLTKCIIDDFQLTNDNLYLLRDFTYQNSVIQVLQIYNLQEQKITNLYIIPASFESNYISFRTLFIPDSTNNVVWFYYVSDRIPVLPGFFPYGFIRFDMATNAYRNILEQKNQFNDFSTSISPLLNSRSYSPIFLGNKSISFWFNDNLNIIGYSFFSINQNVVFINIAQNIIVYAILGIYIFTIYKWKDNETLKRYHLT